ncbi:YafY family protein [Nakamurella sp. A5-74]|uniref:YafY family protein n=1 Tax=Nakamurella sp. A5-74 TaxID=3158264 RepID=A0AAU8DMQ3_9ACTN
MRAERLISLVLMLRQRGVVTAATLAQELEVSRRTVLRDIEALSLAGVPVYAERGRYGGFALLPGWEADFAGLNQDEALALLVAGQGRGDGALGLGAALSTAVRKVVDVLPAGHRVSAGAAARRLLIEPEADLVTRVPEAGSASTSALIEVRRAVTAGHQLRIHYAASGRAPSWRTVHPIGLVTARDRAYLLATRDGADRTYRLSRILAAQELPLPAERLDRVDLERLWRDRCAQYLSEVDQVTAVVTAIPARQHDLARAALAVRVGEPTMDGTVRLEVTFQDIEHAEWALWQVVDDVEVLAPESLRAHLRDRANRIAARHSSPAHR